MHSPSNLVSKAQGSHPWDSLRSSPERTPLDDFTDKVKWAGKKVERLAAQATHLVKQEFHKLINDPNFAEKVVRTAGIVGMIAGAVIALVGLTTFNFSALIGGALLGLASYEIYAINENLDGIKGNLAKKNHLQISLLLCKPEVVSDEVFKSTFIGMLPYNMQNRLAKDLFQEFVLKA